MCSLPSGGTQELFFFFSALSWRFLFFLLFLCNFKIASHCCLVSRLSNGLRSVCSLYFLHLSKLISTFFHWKMTVFLKKNFSGQQAALVWALWLSLFPEEVLEHFQGRSLFLGRLTACQLLWPNKNCQRHADNSFNIWCAQIGTPCRSCSRHLTGCWCRDWNSSSFSVQTRSRDATLPLRPQW